MENQMPQEGRPSRDSSISLEDAILLPPGQSRSDLYTARPRREMYGPVTSGLYLMMPLDLPSTYAADGLSAATQALEDDVEFSSLSVLRIERYLAEEHHHERLSLGVQPLGVNRATVKRYLPDIIQAMDGDTSQAGATGGTMVVCDERSRRESTTATTTATSSASDASPEPIRAHDSNDATSGILPLASSPSRDMPPSLAGLDKSEAAVDKPKHALGSSESHIISADTCEEELELRRILMHHRARGGDRNNRFRVEKQARVRRTVRMRKRSEELK
ncbi:hypothetical protein V8C35DRAFT_176568 [Trichoderma chlorosporum]